MGGDRAPRCVINGAAIARTRYPNVKFIFCGDETQVATLLRRHKNLADCSTIVHTTDVISNDTTAGVALRSGRDSSMRLAINAVADGRAHAVVSSGNTGALMATAKFVLKTLPGIDRPAICAFFPTMKGETVMLDLGANLECDVNNLLDFALMGAIFANIIFGISKPRIGLLNVGSEEIKGRDEVRAAAEQLRNVRLPGTYIGFVEGDDIAKGDVDVIVTDGFTGNVALKTIEGTSKLLTTFLKQTFRSSLMAQMGYMLARSAFTKFRKRVDPRMYNGAMFVGLKGVCVKSHGGTDAIGFANAIGVAYDLVKYKFNQQISDRVQETRVGLAAPLTVATGT